MKMNQPGKMNKDEITEKAQELTIKNVTDGKNKYFSWGFYKGCVVGLEYNNKQKALTREKAIKLYWKIAKERCPFQEEEMVNSFLEGFIDCAEYLLLQNTEHEKAVLKERNIKDCKNFNRAVEKIGEHLNQKKLLKILWCLQK